VVLHDELPEGIITTTVEFVLLGAGRAARKSAWLVLAALQVAVVQEPVCADAMKGESSAENRSSSLTVLA
jgi:hypothetical protein